MRSSTDQRYGYSSNTVTRDITTQHYGYPFGCDGLMDTEETRRFLANISVDTLEGLARNGKVRKGRIPGGRKVGYCRRSVMELVRRMEQ